MFSPPRYFGQRSMKVAMNYHLVARTHSCRGDFRAALQSEKEAYAIYKQTVSNRREKPLWRLKINITVGQRRNIVGMYKAYFKELLIKILFCTLDREKGFISYLTTTQKCKMLLYWEKKTKQKVFEWSIKPLLQIS